jgi:hypothetical protein
MCSNSSAVFSDTSTQITRCTASWCSLQRLQDGVVQGASDVLSGNLHQHSTHMLFCGVITSASA